LLEALSTKGAQDWFGILTDAGLPCGPINTVAGGVQLAEGLGLGPVVEVGEAAVALLGSARVRFPTGGFDAPDVAAAFFTGFLASPPPQPPRRIQPRGRSR